MIESKKLENNEKIERKWAFFKQFNRARLHAACFYSKDYGNYHNNYKKWWLTGGDAGVFEEVFDDFPKPNSLLFLGDSGFGVVGFAAGEALAGGALLPPLKSTEINIIYFKDGPEI